jgi:hypothetical protein
VRNYGHPRSVPQFVELAFATLRAYELFLKMFAVESDMNSEIGATYLIKSRRGMTSSKAVDTVSINVDAGDVVRNFTFRVTIWRTENPVKIPLGDVMLPVAPLHAVTAGMIAILFKDFSGKYPVAMVNLYNALHHASFSAMEVIEAVAPNTKWSMSVIGSISSDSALEAYERQARKRLWPSYHAVLNKLVEFLAPLVALKLGKYKAHHLQWSNNGWAGNIKDSPVIEELGAGVGELIGKAFEASEGGDG